MSKSVAILGRQPAIGLAELESLYGKVSRLGSKCAVVDLPPEQVDFKRLGSSVKLAKLLTIVDTAEWNNLEDYLREHLPKHVCCIPEGKLTLGLSAIGFSVSPKKINATALSLKKIVKETGRPCRIIPNKSAELSSATVLHNKLFTSHNWELLLIKSGSQTYLAQTTNVQNIDAYAERDQKRPKRDARVGMLPPKLAQTLVNLANPKPGSTVLDPFCGTGVVLQEALLMRLDAYGTDIEQRMVDYSQANLQWLEKQTSIENSFSIELGDATTHQWQSFDAVACETYLGRPFSSIPPRDTLNKVISDVNTIHKKFLQNIAKQTKPGTKLCIAVPAWNIKNGFRHLPTLDQLAELGYTRAVFKNASAEDLIYHRPGQIVGRELVILTRK